MRRLPELRALGFPVLVGVSRKSVLGRIHNTDRAAARPPVRLDRARTSWPSRYGADIVRVHDVRAQHVDACRVADAIRDGARPPMSDRILIHRIAIFAYHGVHAEEERLGQRFYVSLDCSLDLSEAGRDDDWSARSATAG